MPPPSSRRSPARELRVESSHKRGHSFESRFPLKAKDDDLVLFSEMQNRERDNFLLHSSDDFDESITKLRYFSDFKLGITIPVRGESSDLLNADGEKNDYDWLLTPPDTPLFPSLDDDESQPVNVPRGRTRSQPISISRTSMCEKTPRTNRSSASPHPLSPSPRSSYSVPHSRTRPSSAPRSSPPPVLQSSTPSRRSSTPPAKPSPPAQRSLTPTLRRMSTGSSGQAISGKRGTSPIKTNRGNSASPKLRGWQSNLPGFSTDAPPNLRTSLTERSASRVRGSSPASGNGRGSVSKFGRQSISPSSSKSARSLHNSEGDHFSSISKPSAASSCEDDVESHASVGVSPNTASKKYIDFANSRAMGFSKKLSRSPSASSAPKRSFDSSLRQMDHRKAPQNMFRPLLSSVPATTFYAGKTNSVHRPVLSRNSSLTTSSNASSELGVSVAPDLEENGHDRSDLAGEWEKRKVPEFQEEVFVFDKLDEISEDTGHDTYAAKLQSGNEIFDGSMTNKIDSKLEQSTRDYGDAVNMAVAYQGSSCAAECSEIDSAEKMSICSKCGKHFMVIDMDVDVCQECSATYGLVGSEEPRSIQVANQEIDSAKKMCVCSKCGKCFMIMDMDVDVCQECSATYGLMGLEEPEIIQVASQDDGNETLGHVVQTQMGMPVLSENRSEVRPSQNEQSSEQVVTNFSVNGGLFLLVSDKREQDLSKQEVFIPSELSAPQCSGKCESQQLQPTASPSDKVNNSEGTGIAVLLTHRSSSRKWPVMQGKSFSATNMIFAEPSYGRDNMNAMKRSFGRDSSSASSSVDLGSSGQTDGRILRQLTSRKGEMENVIGESHTSACSNSESLSAAMETLVHPQIITEEVSYSIAGAVEEENDAVEEILLDAQNPDNSFGDTDPNALEHTSTEQAVSSHTGTSLASSGLLLKSSQDNSLQMYNIIANNLGESCDSCENASEVYLHNGERSVQEIDGPTATPDTSFIEDNSMPSDTGCQDDVSDVATHTSSVVILDQQNDIASFQDAQNDCTPAQMPNCVEDFQEDCISTTSDKNVLLSELESKVAEDPTCGRPTMTIETPRKHVQRSFTLEEATDTILFCSSIVHDVAYRAATIAVEKELALYESSHRTVTFVGTSVSNKTDLRKTSNKHIQNSRKVKRKKPETADKIPSAELASNVQKSEFASCNAEVSHTVDSVKPPKLESKCNCTVM